MKATGFQLRIVQSAVLALTLAAFPAFATEITAEDLEPVGPRNDAYEDAIWGKGLQSEIIYVRPSVTFEAGQFESDRRIRVQTPETEETSTDSRAVRFIFGIVLAAILAAIIYVFVVNANGVGVSFRDTSDKRRSTDTRREDDPEEVRSDQPLEQFLAGLAAMADKREALIMLVSRLLEWAADTHALRLGRSQTARDVLRVLPVDWRHMPALRGLVREAEVVHFGGRDITPERWEECLAAARPIFTQSSTGAA